VTVKRSLKFELIWNRLREWVELCARFGGAWGSILLAAAELPLKGLGCVGLGVKTRAELSHSTGLGGFGVGVAGVPVFGGEGHAPEAGIREQEFHADLNLLGESFHVDHNAFEGRFGLGV
jgi:hypothetical protein